jgi:hypothetical protein
MGRNIQVYASSSSKYSCIGFEVFTALTIKNAVFWDVAPCRSCELTRRFGGKYRLHLQGRKICERGTSVNRLLATYSRWFLASYPEDGGHTFLRNVDSHKICTAPHPRRRHYSNIVAFDGTSCTRRVPAHTEISLF